MRDVFEQMYGNDMLTVSITLTLVGTAVVVDNSIDDFAVVTVVGDVTTVTRFPFEFAVAFGAIVLTLGAIVVVVGIVVVGRSYETITKAPISCVTPGLVKL